MDRVHFKGHAASSVLAFVGAERRRGVLSIPVVWCLREREIDRYRERKRMYVYVYVEIDR